MKTEYIILSNGINVAMVDEEDYAILRSMTWSYVKGSKAVAGSRHREYAHGSANYSMHRFILGAPPSFDVDHVNGDGLDNRKANLRLCTTAQNNWNTGPRADNTSGFKGVSFQKSNGKFCAKIKIRGVQKHLGYFETPEEAAEVYRLEALARDGEFNRTKW